MNLQPRIFCAAINFLKLDQLSDKILLEASLDNDEKTLQSIRDNLGFAVDQIAVVKKCNAVMLVVTYFSDCTLDFVRGRVLSTWDDTSAHGLDNSYKYIKCYENDKALTFLCECALGVNSVTPGDSQVLAQICDALVDANKIQITKFSMLGLIAHWIKSTAAVAKRDTELYDGNISLERAATEIIKKNSSKLSTVTVIGLGRTGSLVTKILSQELKLKVTVTNRSINKVTEIVKKYPTLKSTVYNDVNTIMRSDCIVIAISENNETQQYVAKLFENSFKETFFIDLSSPSVSSKLKIPKSVIIYDIDKLSQYARNTLATRKPEIDKVRAIILKSIPAITMLLSKEYGKISADKLKKSAGVKLDTHTLEIFRVRDAALRSIREFYNKKEFVEVTTPYIVGVSSDPPKVDKGGMFSVDWPNGDTAFLRQSNQLYKQMIVASGLPKIYEIGPFWRLEESTTYRHLLESIGLDVEVANPASLESIYEMAYNTIKSAFVAVNQHIGVKESHLLIPAYTSVPVLRYSQAIELLQLRGFNIKYGEDLGLVGESKLGQIMKKERSSDALIIKEYPDTIKKFYTKKIANGETETFDIIIDGWELVSGAIRNTDRRNIEKSMLLSGISTTSYAFYLSIIDQAVPHGGFCLGIDRLVAKILDKETVSDAIAFPRTTERLIP